MGAWLVFIESSAMVHPRVLGLYLTRAEANRAKDAAMVAFPGADVTVGLLTEVQRFGG